MLKKFLLFIIILINQPVFSNERVNIQEKKETIHAQAMYEKAVDSLKNQYYHQFKSSFSKKISKFIKLFDLNINFHIDIDFEDIILKTNHKYPNRIDYIKRDYPSFQIPAHAIMHEESIFGFRSGQYKFEENIILQTSIQAFFELLSDELLPHLQGKEIEILAIGYTDNLNVNSIDYYNLITKKGSYSKCRNHTYPPISIYIQNDIHSSNQNQFPTHKIGHKINNNCELSYARGYEALKNLKKYNQILSSEYKNSIKYSYSGQGIYKSESKYKQRRVLFRIMQSNNK